MDCCRSARRLGGDDVKVIVRSRLRRDEGLAVGEGGRDARRHPDPRLPRAEGLRARERQAHRHDVRAREGGVRRAAAGARWCPPASPTSSIACDEVLIAVGQENAFPWIERDSGIAFDEWGMPVVDKTTFAVDAAGRVLRRRRGVRAEEHHQGGGARPRGGGVDRPPAARRGRARPPAAAREPALAEDGHPRVELRQRRSRNDARFKVPWAKAEIALTSIKVEVELGFDAATAFKEAQRCLNCDVQTVFSDKLCIECDACVDICPMDCISFTGNGEETDLRTRLKAPAKNLDAGPVRLGAAEDGARDGEGRGRVPALRPVRRALPDRGVGHAEVPVPADDRGARVPRREEAGAAEARCGDRHEAHRSRQRLRRQVRQRQRLRLGSRQRAVRQGDPAHGRAGQPAQHLPEQHPGPADLVRSARQRARPSRPPRRRRHDGRDEPADLGRRTWPRSNPAATCSTTARSRCRRARSATTCR